MTSKYSFGNEFAKQIEELAYKSLSDDQADDFINSNAATSMKFPTYSTNAPHYGVRSSDDLNIPAPLSRPEAYKITNSHISSHHINLGAADVRIDGVDEINAKIAAINDRLAILEPDFKKFAKYEALKKAYDYYKMVEKMCYEDEIEGENKKL